MPDPVDAAAFAELVARMGEVLDALQTAVRRILVQTLTGPGPFTLTDVAHGGKQLRVGNGGSTLPIVLQLPEDAEVGTFHMIRRISSSPVKVVALGGAQLVPARTGHNGCAALGSCIRVMCEVNVNGVSAVWYLDGDTGSIP